MMFDRKGVVGEAHDHLQLASAFPQLLRCICVHTGIVFRSTGTNLVPKNSMS